MLRFRHWLIHLATHRRASLYIIACGVASLVTIPVLAAIPGTPGPGLWILRIGGYSIVMMGVAMAVHYVTQLLVPPRPTRPPSSTPRTEQLDIVGYERPHEEAIDEADDGGNDSAIDYRVPQMEYVQLSRFAQRRIASQHPGLEKSPVLFEQGKVPHELFFQFTPRKRIPLDEPRKRFGITRHFKREKSTTIYGKLFAVLLSLWVLWLIINLVTAPGITVPPPFATTLITLALIAAGVTTIRLLHRLSCWYYWRLIALDANEAEGFDAKVVIIDMPRFFPGGSVPPLSMTELSLIMSSTAEKEEEEQTFRSILAGWLGIRWIILDSFSQKDQRFNWLGPFRNAPTLVSILDRARTAARVAEAQRKDRRNDS